MGVQRCDMYMYMFIHVYTCVYISTYTHVYCIQPYTYAHTCIYICITSTSRALDGDMSESHNDQTTSLTSSPVCTHSLARRSAPCTLRRRIRRWHRRRQLRRRRRLRLPRDLHCCPRRLRRRLRQLALRSALRSAVSLDELGGVALLKRMCRLCVWGRICLYVSGGVGGGRGSMHGRCMCIYFILTPVSDISETNFRAAYIVLCA